MNKIKLCCSQWLNEYYEMIYCVLFSISIFFMIMNNSIITVEASYAAAGFVGFICKIIKLITFILFLLLIFLNMINGKYKVKIFLPIFILIAIASAVSRDTQLIYYGAIVFAISDSDFDKVIKCCIKVQFVSIMLFVVLASTNIIWNAMFDFGTRNRYALGFTYPTFVPMMYTFVLLQILYITRDAIRWADICTFFALSVFLFVLTNSKFIYVVQLLILALMVVDKLYLLDKVKKRFCKLGDYFISIVPSLFLCISIIVSLAYNDRIAFWSKLNDLLTNRLMLMHKAIYKYGVSVFGKPVKWYGHYVGEGQMTYNYVDNSYIQILITYGILITLLVIVGYTLIIVVSRKNRDYIMCQVILIIMLLSLIEPRMINLVFNPFVLLFGKMLSKQQNLFTMNKGDKCER